MRKRLVHSTQSVTSIDFQHYKVSKGHIVSDHSSSVRTGRSWLAKWQVITSPISLCKQVSRDGHPKSKKIHGEIIHNDRKYQGQHSRRREQMVHCEHVWVCWTDPA